MSAVPVTRMDVDIAIVGGGLVGSSLACALHDVGYRVALVEATASSINTSPPGFDDRSVALSYGSQQIFTRFGLWNDIARTATPIRQIHVSDRGAPGFVRIQAEQENLPALGYVVVARELGNALHTALTKRPAIQVLSPALLGGVSMQVDAAELRVKPADSSAEDTNDRPAESIVRCRLLVGADGANSSVRKHLQMGVNSHDYRQTAIVANVMPGKDHRGLAFERFTQTGPLALLPLSEGRCALIWSAEAEIASELLTASDDEFLARLQQQFGYRLGRLQRIGKRNSYPLMLVQSKEQARSRVVLQGNAAHALHPVGGQGFNLGLRDVAELVESLSQAYANHEDPGDAQRLQQYAARRQRDQHNVTSFTDALARGFVIHNGPLKFMRSIGLTGLDLLPGAKPWLASQAMGARSYQMRHQAHGLIDDSRRSSGAASAH